MSNLVYFSSVSGNTHRFVQKLERDALRLPIRGKDETPLVTEPYVLVLPTYGGGTMGGAVPKAVIRFLNVPGNRALIRGVVAGGNTNFGTAYCLAGDIVSTKCKVPVLHRFEIFGTPEDVDTVNQRLDSMWQTSSQPTR